MPAKPRKRAADQVAAKSAARQPDSAPALVLTGPPDALRATVSLENTGDKPVSVRGLVVRRPDAADVVARFGAIVRPGATNEVPVNVALPATTAPGEYDVELEVGGQTRSARLRVEAKLSARLSPTRVLAAPGETAVTLTLVNEGNVDIPLARHSRARTSDRGSARPATDDNDEDLGPDIDLHLDLSAGASLAAGETLVVAGVLGVPEGLDPTRRHVAVIPVGVNDLTVLVLPRDD